MTNNANPNEAYVQAVTDAIRAGHDDIKAYLTKRCPECDGDATDEPEDHVLVQGWCVVACEGYWVVDPNLVGIESPRWMNWMDDHL